MQDLKWELHVDAVDKLNGIVLFPGKTRRDIWRLEFRSFGQTRVQELQVCLKGENVDRGGSSYYGTRNLFQNIWEPNLEWLLCVLCVEFFYIQ